MKGETFVFFGQVGSGKGTQIKLLINYLKDQGKKEIVYAGTGEAFRKLIDSDNSTAKIVKETMTRGELQPDFLTTALFTNILIDNLNEEKGLIADGYPRTPVQSESFEKMMRFYGREKIKIFHIQLSENEAMQRNLLRGRADDTEEGLKRRFNEYRNNVLPAMNYFQGKKDYQIFTINGEQEVEKVHEDIIKILEENR